METIFRSIRGIGRFGKLPAETCAEGVLIFTRCFLVYAVAVALRWAHRLRWGTSGPRALNVTGSRQTMTTIAAEGKKAR